MAEMHDFINIYIKKLVEEVEELTKSKIILTAKEEFKNAEIEELQKKLTDLEAQAMKEKDDVAKTWQLALNEKDTEVTQLRNELADTREKLRFEISQATEPTNSKEEPKKKTKKEASTLLLD